MKMWTLKARVSSDTSDKEVLEGWTPLLMGWFKANTDAIFKDAKTTISLVVGNELGETILIMSKISVCKTALMAELAALELASGIIEAKGWPNVLYGPQTRQFCKSH